MIISSEITIIMIRPNPFTIVGPTGRGAVILWRCQGCRGQGSNGQPSFCLASFICLSRVACCNKSPSTWATWQRDIRSTIRRRLPYDCAGGTLFASCPPWDCFLLPTLFEGPSFHHNGLLHAKVMSKWEGTKTREWCWDVQLISISLHETNFGPVTADCFRGASPKGIQCGSNGQTCKCFVGCTTRN